MALLKKGVSSQEHLLQVKIGVEKIRSDRALITLCAYLFDTFEHELLVSSLMGLVDTFSHFSIADNSQWLFERIDDIPESSFSFIKCRPKRIFIIGYFNISCAAIFSLF